MSINTLKKFGWMVAALVAAKVVIAVTNIDVMATDLVSGSDTSS